MFTKVFWISVRTVCYAYRMATFAYRNITNIMFAVVPFALYFYTMHLKDWVQDYTQHLSNECEVERRTVAFLNGLADSHRNVLTNAFLPDYRAKASFFCRHAKFILPTHTLHDLPAYEIDFEAYKKFLFTYFLEAPLRVVQLIADSFIQLSASSFLLLSVIYCSYVLYVSFRKYKVTVVAPQKSYHANLVKSHFKEGGINAVYDLLHDIYPSFPTEDCGCGETHTCGSDVPFRNIKLRLRSLDVNTISRMISAPSVVLEPRTNSSDHYNCHVEDGVTTILGNGFCYKLDADISLEGCTYFATSHGAFDVHEIGKDRDFIYYYCQPRSRDYIIQSPANAARHTVSYFRGRDGHRQTYKRVGDTFIIAGQTLPAAPIIEAAMTFYTAPRDPKFSDALRSYLSGKLKAYDVATDTLDDVFSLTFDLCDKYATSPLGTLRCRGTVPTNNISRIILSISMFTSDLLLFITQSITTYIPELHSRTPWGWNVFRLPTYESYTKDMERRCVIGSGRDNQFGKERFQPEATVDTTLNCDLSAAGSRQDIPQHDHVIGNESSERRTDPASSTNRDVPKDSSVLHPPGPSTDIPRKSQSDNRQQILDLFGAEEEDSEEQCTPPEQGHHTSARPNDSFTLGLHIDRKTFDGVTFKTADNITGYVENPEVHGPILLDSNPARQLTSVLQRAEDIVRTLPRRIDDKQAAVLAASCLQVLGQCRFRLESAEFASAPLLFHISGKDASGRKTIGPSDLVFSVPKKTARPTTRRPCRSTGHEHPTPARNSEEFSKSRSSTERHRSSQHQPAQRSFSKSPRSVHKRPRTPLSSSSSSS